MSAFLYCKNKSRDVNIMYIFCVSQMLHFCLEFSSMVEEADASV